jgi:hypothetical protein
MFVQQKIKFPIKNVEKKEKKVQNSLFPNHVRALVVGPSGCGKTVLLYNLIVQKEGLKFTNLYIISQSLEQEKYKTLIQVFEKLDGEVQLHMMSTCDITPKDVPIGSVVVFDDVKNDENIASFYSMGRHRKISCFYLCQTYTKIPKALIRDNSNFIVLFRQDELNLKHVYHNHVGNDFSYLQFKNICDDCWGLDDYGFLVIDKTSHLNDGRYRCKIDKFYCSK